MTEEQWVNRIVGQGEVDPSDLLANPLNWRIHPRVQQDALEGAIEEIGWIDDIIVNKRTGYVLDGHLRVSLALKRDQTSVPVKYVDLSEREEQIAIATLDPITAMATTDKEMLEDLLKGIESDSEKLTASLAQIAARAYIDLDSDDREYVPPFDAAQELCEKYGVEEGQVWDIEDHRIMCGDSTNVDDVAKLMGEEDADFIFSSPPYNVGVEYGDHDDETVGWEQYGEFLRSALTPFIDRLKNGRMLGWNTGSSRKTFPWHQYILMEELGLTYLRLMIWKKMGVPIPQWHITTANPLARRLTPNWTFELIALFSKGKVKFGSPVSVDPLCGNDIFMINQTEHSRELPEGASQIVSGVKKGLVRRKSAHPAPFPTRLPRMFIEHLCDYGKIVVDPFLGSGATIGAAHQIDRLGYGMELEPKYVAVSLDRLERMGLKAKLMSK